jgi:D-alanyl-D-alanine carboxypeptidase
MFPTSCGTAWGHNGVVPGYFTFIFSSADGERQALLTVNHDAQTLPEQVGPLFFALIEKAFCSTAGDR